MQGTLGIKSLLVERYKYLLRDDHCQDVGDGKVNKIWSLTLTGLQSSSETISEPLASVLCLAHALNLVSAGRMGINLGRDLS